MIYDRVMMVLVHCFLLRGITVGEAGLLPGWNWYVHDIIKYTP
jgi:hypothetical protein